MPIANKDQQIPRLVRILESRFELCRDENGELFAVDKLASAHVAIALERLRGELAEIYFKQFGKAANINSLNSVNTLAQARARQGRQRYIPLRVGGEGDSIWIDIGDDSGRVVKVMPGSWTIEDRAPFPFRRTEATHPLRVSKSRRGDIRPLRKLFNLTDHQWEFLVNWMVIAWVPDIPHVVPVIMGGPGRAKTTITSMVLSVIDPSLGALSGNPGNERDLRTHAAGSLVIGLENVTKVSADESDLLSRLVTGHESRERKYYTNADITIVSLGRRVIIMNGVTIEGIRPDLQDRCVNFSPRNISKEERRTDAEIDEAFQKAIPGAVSYLLDCLAGALQRKADGLDKLEDLPRMADFAQWLAHVDAYRGTRTLGGYRASVQNAATATALESPVGFALHQWLEMHHYDHSDKEHSTRQADRVLGKHVHPAGKEDAPGHAHNPDGTVAYWRKNSAQWLNDIEPYAPSGARGEWPGAARGFVSRMRMIESGLVLAGWKVEEIIFHNQAQWRIGLGETPPDDAS